MKLFVPILWPSRFTPAPGAGLQLAEAAAQDELGAWLHGSLTLPEAELRTSHWRLQVALVAFAESNQIPFISKLLRQDAFLDEGAGEEVLVDGLKLRRTSFSVHTSLIFGALPRERMQLHAAAGERLSRSAVIAPAPQLALDKGTLPGATPARVRSRAAWP